MKKVIIVAVAVVLVLLAVSLVSCPAGGVSAGETEVKELSLGQVFDADGVRFTLEEFCFAKKVDYDAYDPDNIDGASYSPNDGYIFGHIKYTIVNNSKTELTGSSVKITMEYGDGYTYGEGSFNYKAACTGDNKGDLSIDPLMEKSYNGVITNCPASIQKPQYDIKIIVSIRDKKCVYVIPASKVTVSEGTYAQKEVSFTKADSKTESWVRNMLDGGSYEWWNGSIKCELSFTKKNAKLVQTLSSGYQITATGAYVVGTDKLKVNYGQGDVYYWWSNSNDGYLNLGLVED